MYCGTDHSLEIKFTADGVREAGSIFECVYVCAVCARAGGVGKEVWPLVLLVEVMEGQLW